MARYRRYRKYSRRNRGRWSANIQEIGTTTITIPSTEGAWYRDFTLAFNPTQVNTAVSQIYTVKNFEVTFEISNAYSQATLSTSSISFVEDIVAYIMFVPQGMQVSANYNLQHPEYIMAYKYLGSPTSDNNITSLAQPPKIRTRLSRKLNTGDSVILLLKGNHTQATNNLNENLEFHGIARWWTKAN